MRRWVADGVVAPWAGRIGDWSVSGVVEREETPRWVGTPRMSALTRYLSADLVVVPSCRVVGLHRADERWTLESDNGETHGPFDAVILTCPGPQAAALAPAHSEVHRRASALEYSPCWAAMITVGDAVHAGLDGYMCDHAVAAWIAHDSSKPGRPLPGRWVVHAQAAWSTAYEEAEPVDVEGALGSAFTEVVGLAVDTIQVHRWRYALAQPATGPSMVFEGGLSLGLCGDALTGGTVESAWQSAVDLVECMAGKRA